MEEKNLYFFIVIALILIALLVISVLLIFNVSQKRIINEISKAQAKELEFAQKLLKNSIETQENERTRIARELHDGITSKLNVINININLLKSKRENQESEILSDIKKSINDSINLSREISHNLMPPSFSKFGIQTAIDDVCLKVNRSRDIKISVDISHDWTLIPKMHSLHVFRIIQELISNTIKHATATSIQLNSFIENNVIIIDYHDNGKGVTHINDQVDGIGLKNIKARIKLLSASISNKETNTKGYNLKFIIPTKSKQNENPKNI